MREPDFLTILLFKKQTRANEGARFHHSAIHDRDTVKGNEGIRFPPLASVIYYRDMCCAGW